MRARLKLKPGQKGTKKLLARYGDRLFCVRYRYDEERQRRYTTVELIVEEVEWKPRARAPAGDTIIDIHVAWGDLELSGRVKSAGGRWNRARRVWEIRYDQALQAGLIKPSHAPAAPKNAFRKASSRR